MFIPEATSSVASGSARAIITDLLTYMRAAPRSRPAPPSHHLEDRHASVHVDLLVLAAVGPDDEDAPPGDLGEVRRDRRGHGVDLHHRQLGDELPAAREARRRERVREALEL